MRKRVMNSDKRKCILHERRRIFIENFTALLVNKNDNLSS